MNDVKHLTGHLIRFLYQKDSGWGIALFKSPDENAQVKIKGNVGLLQPKVTYELAGHFQDHPKYGRSFDVTSFQVVDLKTADQYQNFFKTMVPGMGDILAQKVIDQYGPGELFEKILADPAPLIQIKGISASIQKSIVDKIQDLVTENKFTTTFFQADLKMDFLIHLKNYFSQMEHPDEAIETILTTSFYRYARDHHLYPFEEVDKVACYFQKLSPYDVTRLAWNLHYLIEDTLQQTGNTYTSKKLLQKRLRDVCGIFDEELFEEALNQAIEWNLIYQRQDAFFSEESWNDEKLIATEVARRVSRNSSYYEIEQLNALIDQIETELALEFQVDEFKYDQTQRDALIAFANADFYLLTGGPGTGKTTVLKGIVKLFQKLENARLEDIAVAAPTGRAAARINEIDASLKAKTIHKLLKATDNGMFDVTAANPLEEQLIIIDESSMIENKLFARLLEASPLAQKIVFIGDENQLPSVGYGEVFANLLAVKSIPKTQLEKVHRQKEGNGIINLAYKILNNEVHELEDLNLPNVTTRFNQGDDLDAIDEIFRNSLKLNPDVLQFQVITSFYKGTLGINAVNKSLQSTYQAEVLNHPLDDVTHAVMRKDSCFYEHDKVMHLVNDSALGLSNGDVGSIEQIVLKNQKLDYAQVRFNEEVKKLTSDNFKNLTLSYGCSVHKTQGSEYQQVVFAVEAGLHPFFLNKKLIYTAITRAKQNLYLVGDWPTLLSGINREAAPRKTALVSKVKYYIKKEKGYNQT